MYEISLYSTCRWGNVSLDTGENINNVYILPVGGGIYLLKLEKLLIMFIFYQ